MFARTLTQHALGHQPLIWGSAPVRTYEGPPAGCRRPLAAGAGHREATAWLSRTPPRELCTLTEVICRPVTKDPDRRRSSQLPRVSTGALPRSRGPVGTVTSPT